MYPKIRFRDKDEARREARRMADETGRIFEIGWQAWGGWQIRVGGGPDSMQWAHSCERVFPGERNPALYLLD